MKKIKILISGMHCSSCAQNVEKSVSKIPGVARCSVSLLTHKGIVEAEDFVKEMRKKISK